MLAVCPSPTQRVGVFPTTLRLVLKMVALVLQRVECSFSMRQRLRPARTGVTGDPPAIWGNYGQCGGFGLSKIASNARENVAHT